MKKLLSFFLVAAFIVALYGCHSGGHAPFVSIDKSVPLAANVTSNGQFDHPIEFPSGAKITTTKDGTLPKDAKVEVVETNTTIPTPDGSVQNVYIYNIEAKTSNNEYIQSLNEPLTISLPTNHLGTEGVYYVAFRYSENEDWQYRMVAEDGTISLNTRFSSLYDIICKFIRLNRGLQLTLFKFDIEKVPEEKKETIVSVKTFKAAVTSISPDTTEITVKDNKYTDDINLSLNLEGENLTKLIASNVKVKVTFKSANSELVDLKINGITVKVDKDNTAIDRKYSYSFALPTLSTFKNQDISKATLNYVLGTKDILVKDFPGNVLIEISGEVPDSPIKTFGYSESLKFGPQSVDPQPGPEPKPGPEPEPEPTGSTYTITYNLDGGSLAESVTNPSEYGEASETFTLNNPIKTGYTFAGWTGTGLEEATTEVTITTGSTGNKEYTATWTINSYKLDLIAGTGIATVTGGGTYEYNSTVTASCTMEAGYEFASWSGDFNTETVTITSNATMIANASLIRYSINYDLKKGNVKTANPTSYDVSSSTITLKNPTKNGYRFLGWTGTGIEEGTASETVTIPQGSTGDRTYVAKWTLDVDDISFTIPNSNEVITFKRPQPTDDFFMGIYEVTGLQYVAINGGEDPSHSQYVKDFSEHPVESVSWNNASATCVAFTKMLKEAGTLPDGYEFRLPTIAQWVYTCDAGGVGGYFMVDDGTGNGVQVTESTLSKYAVFSKDGSQNVGRKKPNLWGFYDMQGNVSEWCNDIINGSYRNIRGASWATSSASSCTSNNYSDINLDPNRSSDTYGFRMILVPTE